ncbi:MAG: Hsp20/alpha crystallin family protein [Phototrophicales bacterium]|nr:MAG: heat-shock protein Hsp20 [Phototrophicales bacterium]
MATMIRWNPVQELADIQRAMNRIMEETNRTLPLDIHERDDAYVIAANIPGVNADDIDIRLHEDVLTISAEIPAPQVEENTRVLVRERGYGKYSRSVTLNFPVDADKIEAAYENGVLVLILPKLPEAQPRTIKVRAN